MRKKTMTRYAGASAALPSPSPSYRALPIPAPLRPAERRPSRALPHPAACPPPHLPPRRALMRLNWLMHTIGTKELLPLSGSMRCLLGRSGGRRLLFAVAHESKAQRRGSSIWLGRRPRHRVCRPLVIIVTEQASAPMPMGCTLDAASTWAGNS